MNKLKWKLGLNLASGHITILVRTLTSSPTQTLTLTHFYLKPSLYPHSCEDKLDCASLSSDRCLLVLIMSDL